MRTETSKKSSLGSKPKERHSGDGHRKRLREKFLSSGLTGFHDYEVIELLLTLGTPRKDCKAAAKEALATFGSLPGVLEASIGELGQVHGIGPKNALGIKLAKAVADRYFERRLTGKDPLNNSKDLFAFLQHAIGGKGRECFEVLFLDAKNRVIKADTLFQGSLTVSAVYPREVIHAALTHRAAALIFAHNHPSGEPEPSADDVALTRRLVYACRAMGITVHEHLIIGNNAYYSFADQGVIAQMNRDYDQQMT
jgi:DNA repair protein RadC